MTDELPQETPAPGTAQAWLPSGPGGPRPGDDPLIAQLARDGRAPAADLAAATHWHEPTVRRRVEELRRAGRLPGLSA